MRTRRSSHRSKRLPATVRDLVDTVARSMGISVEIWNGPGRPTERVHLGAVCEACQEQTPRQFDRCRKRRSYLSREAAPVAEALCEACPTRRRLARRASSRRSAPVLFAFGYGKAGDAGGEEDARIQSFLEDVHTLLEVQVPPRCALHEIPTLLATLPGGKLMAQVGAVPCRDARQPASTQGIVDAWRQALGGRLALLYQRPTGVAQFAFEAPIADRIDHVGMARWGAFASRMLEALVHSGRVAEYEALAAGHPIARALAEPVECLAMPVFAGGETVGVLCGFRSAGGDLERGEATLLRCLADQVGLALQNEVLVDRLQSFLTSTVKALVAAIDAKDPEARGHSERVNIVAMLLGHEMNLELEDLEALYWGSLLHDVGKIGMPDAVIGKAEPLEADEVAVLREHPTRGWEMLRAVEPLQAALAAVRHHHEHWDGSGYPAGLAGQEIPQVARILAVADSFDAMVSNRSYRKGRDPSAAMREIEAQSGRQFDPEVVEALERLLPLLEKHRWVLMSGSPALRDG